MPGARPPSQQAGAPLMARHAAGRRHASNGCSLAGSTECVGNCLCRLSSCKSGLRHRFTAFKQGRRCTAQNAQRLPTMLWAAINPAGAALPTAAAVRALGAVTGAATVAITTTTATAVAGMAPAGAITQMTATGTGTRRAGPARRPGWSSYFVPGAAAAAAARRPLESRAEAGFALRPGTVKSESGCCALCLLR
jgi:hypothetical protein